MKMSKCSYPVYFISIGKSLKFPTKLGVFQLHRVSITKVMVIFVS